jgi:hypothetical protein
MRSLTPCPSCRRHVESGETACPFCAAALEPSPDARLCQGPCSGHASPRLGRVAMVAAGTTLLCAACTRTAIVHYGPAIIVDSGAETDDADGGADAGTDALPDAER